MNFLLNMNVHRDMAAPLKKRGHVCRHVGDIGLSRAKDVEIVAEAKRTGEVIITHDLDYGHLLAFSGEKAPSVIILRLRIWAWMKSCPALIQFGRRSSHP